ncbi:flippase [uncultured Limosilactobacillus sp.]|uniref:flippase n=1 Tax=uncultured Limosilactobacillus sp. TaxID=2837629 RepID=UPI0025DB9054|nr:flippase [uncultured Limosilactobacillus sp.]
MKVIKNYLYNAGYQILLMLAPLLTTPYVARVLGPHESGINSYTNAWVTVFYLIGQMGITLYGNREVAYNRDNKYERSRTFWGVESLQLITIALSLIAYLTAVFLFSTTFQKFYLLQTFWIIAAGVDVSWYFMGMEDFKKTVTRNTIVKLVSIALIFVLVRTEADLWKYILLLGLAQVGGNVTLWPYLKNSIQWVNPKEWHPFSHFYPSLLLFIPTITTQIYLFVNRVMLGKIGQPSALGQFDYADKIVKLVLAVVTATGTVMLPHVANKFANGDVKGVRESLYNSFDFVTSLAVPMMFGIMAVSAKFAPWFLGSKYSQTGQIIFLEAPVIVLIAWSNVTGTQYLMPVNRVNEFTISVSVGAAVNVIANFILIFPYSSNGAAIATVISEFSVTAMQLWLIRTTIKRRKLFNNIWKYFVSGLIMYFVVLRLSQIMHMNLVNLCVQVIIGALVYFIGIYTLKATIIKQAKNYLQK